MLSFESDLYIMECERQFAVARAELRFKRGIAEEINNAGLGFPDWLTALVRRLGARRPPAPAIAATTGDIATASPVSRRLCAGKHRRKSLVCDDCGAVIRTPKPICSTTARRARKRRGATIRQTV